MRLLKGLAVGLIAVGLTGCSVAASQPSGGGATPGGGAAPAPPVVVTSTAPPAAPVSPELRTGARAAAATFYGLYSASQFSAFWNLLSPATKRQVSRSVWVSVHEACPDAAAGKPRIIKAVTVFGSAAIVTEAIAGAPSNLGTAEDIFTYANGRWSYSPADLNIYHQGSVAADIGAAKAAGFCTGWKIF
jgi:hypothetical protein